jgi:hypothetical protein
MPDRSDEFRAAASECLRLARTTSDKNTRASLLILAQKWFAPGERVAAPERVQCGGASLQRRPDDSRARHAATAANPAQEGIGGAVPLGRVLINQEARRGAFDVRLSPNSGAKADIAGDPRRANSRLMQRSK